MTSNDVNIIFSTATKRESAVNSVEVSKTQAGRVNKQNRGNIEKASTQVASVVLEVAKKDLISNEELSKAQQDDPIVGPVFDIVLKRKELSRAEVKLLPKDSKTLLRQKWKLGIENNVLIRRTKTLRQIVLPECYHHLVYSELHEKLAHLGSEKTWDLARKRFYWANMQRSIEHFIRKKCRCIKSKRPPVLDRAPLVPIVATFPFEFVSLDYVHLDRGKGGYEFALVVIYHFTRFAQIYATKKNDGISAADKLFNEFMLHYGFPARIHSDQGQEFENKLFRRLQELTGVSKSKTTPYHPESDGGPERMNRTLISMLKTLGDKEKVNWPKHLSKLAFAHNVTVSKSTGYSPYYLMFGRSARLPIDEIFGIDSSEGDVSMRKSWKQYAEDWQNSMNQAFDIARGRCIASGERNKKHYDKRARGVDIEVGDRVLYKNREKGGTGKLRNFWDNRVFVVTGKEEDIPVYSIKPEKGSGKVKRVHRNDIMACNEILSDEEAEEIIASTGRQRGTKKPKETVSESRGATGSSKAAKRVAVDSDNSEDEFVVLEQQEDEEVISEVEETEVEGIPSEEHQEPGVETPEELEESDPEVSARSDPQHVSEVDDSHEDHENEADSESSEVDSNSSTPPRRRGNRTRVPKSVFTYNEFGNPTVIR